MSRKDLKVVLNVGLSASGKSTWTNEFINKNQNWVSVNRDSYRYMLTNKGWCEPKIEDLISEMVDINIIKCLNRNLNVIVDATNLKEKYINHFIDLVKYKADVEFRVFDVPLKTCIERDKLRERSVGETVIKKQHKDYKNLIDCYAFQNVSKLPPYEDRFVPLKQDETLPDAVIFDLDGTLAIMGKRSPYDWDRVDVDDPNDVVIEQVGLHRYLGRKIIVVSGRDEAAKEKTLYWLDFYNIEFDEIFMRPLNDMRKDTIVKKEIYDNHIKDKYNVICVYDDRTSVKKMWVNEGLFVFDCNVLNKEF